MGLTNSPLADQPYAALSSLGLARLTWESDSPDHRYAWNKNEVFAFVRRREGSAQGLTVHEVLPLSDIEPLGKSSFTLWVLFPKLAEHFARDDVHAASVSRNEIMRTMR
jgi:hypothetical protein